MNILHFYLFSSQKAITLKIPDEKIMIFEFDSDIVIY